MSDLSAVLEAAKAREAAESAYRDAIVNAHEGGASYAELASVLGVSRQAVRQLVQRAGQSEEAMRKRLEELDARYEAVVTAMTDKPGYFKRVTAYQNGQSKKLGRRGLAYKPVSVQMRDYAESLLLKALEDHPERPEVKRLVSELDEAASLRKKLTALDETRAFGAPLD